ncbi:MAG TPA: hypothetical protein VGQ38_20830 [Gaiellaceae bacterium]|jgi:hypothetical protein|nr:hypothetical protein [Gaiellaceae bacterium]
MGDEATNEAAPEAKAPAEKKRSLLRRIPRSLIVTLLGIALTAWLLPAFTRQWDDRQKAQDVRATVASQIATGTAHMIVATRRASRVRHQTKQNHSPDVINAEQVADENLYDSWLEYRIKLEAMMRAYFKPDVLRTFEHYNDSMVVLIGASTQRRPIYSARDLQRQFAMNPERAHEVVDWEQAYLPGAVLVYLDQDVLSEENRLVGRVFHSHVAGYSTTTHDLIHDLIP